MQFVQSKEHFIGSTDNPLTLGFSMQDEKVIGIFTYLGHEKIEAHEKEDN